MTPEATGLQLRSTVRQDGTLEVSLARVPIPDPKPEEVVVRVDASPINPSDLGLMLAGADLTTVAVSGSSADPVVIALRSGMSRALPSGRRPRYAPGRSRGGPPCHHATR